MCHQPLKYVLLFTFVMISNGSRNILVGIVNRYEQYGPAFDSRHGQEILSSPKYQNRLCGPPNLLFNEHPGTCPGVKRPGRKVDYLPPPSVEMKNEWSYTSTPPICLCGVDRDNFSLHNLTQIVEYVLVST